MQREGLAAAVPGADQQRALVIGIDQAGAVAQRDAVAVAQAGARQHDRAQVRIFDMDGDAAGNQRRIPRLQGELGFQRGAQVHAGAGFGGIGRQGPGIAEAGIEQLHLQRVQGRGLGHACNLWAIRDNSCSASSALVVPGNTCSPPCQ
ncbi:hypothetical protein D9M71_693250 [compost metagenome]